MSERGVFLRYKGDEIVQLENDGEVTLLTKNSFLEDDIEVEVKRAETLVSKTVTQNGEYDPADDEADGYSDVTVNVPNTYAAGDEGKVVSNGELVSQTSVTKTANGTYDTTLNNQVVVNVQGGGGGDPSLPSAYQEVEYLICTGHEWITLASPSLPEQYIIDAVAKLTSYTSYPTLFGYKTSSNNSQDMQVTVTSGGNPSIFKRNRNNSIQNGGIGVLDDGKLYFHVANTDTRRTLYIGKYYNESDSSAGLPWNGYIYSVDIYDYTLQKIIKLVPCYRKADDVIGFYDVYNDTFYPNEGTGAFGKGADVNT